MKKVLVTVVFALLCFTFSFAQTPMKKDVMKQKVTAMRGANPKIKMDAPTIDKEMAKPSATRGSCAIAFSNSTGYYVKIYVDGNYKGTLAPYESGTVTVYSGYTTIYCITTGGTYDWSAAGNCDGS